ncbi:hypothetical protein KUV51_05340 [Tateyamaria omphalii]|uniref:hypothetical protein n=1 Tax=Tateyamaria omphalii TaxID=299262 RepID=UPI001C99FC51|nr:hypothetical protein [Tateyamaria omphalii]MBY5932416.1 hypothetical protein [Tateyamaria omphalii]
MAHAEWTVHGSVVLGTMTEGSWHETVNPNRLRFAGSHLVGGAVGVDRPLGNSRFRLGAEAQLVAHFGRQDHFELSVPIVLRYQPKEPTVLSSLAAGLGLSYATKVPQVEIDRNGASQRLFVHWMAEIEFDLPDPALTSFLRLHHRSDGYGIFEVDAGSTGFVFGVRKRF